MTTVTHRVFTYDDLPKPITEAETRDDLAGYWYAFGRLDQGHPPVAEMAHVDGSPSATSTAWLFGALWMASQREFRDHGGYCPGMQTAWDNFVASGGHTLQRTR